MFLPASEEVSHGCFGLIGRCDEKPHESEVADGMWLAHAGHLRMNGLKCEYDTFKGTLIAAVLLDWRRKCIIVHILWHVQLFIMNLTMFINHLL